MWTCALCGTGNIDDHDYCTVCGTKNPQLEDNYCDNHRCGHYKEILDDSEQRYCGFCGSLTVYGEKLGNR